MSIFSSTFMYGFASLFAVINPVGMSAVYLSMTKDLPQDLRQKGSYKVAIFGLILLVATFFLGTGILKFFGISIASMQVAGGILVFASAWKAFDAPPSPPQTEPGQAKRNADIILFPLAMPLTIGAGAMAVMIALASKLQIAHHYTFEGIAGALSSIVVVMVLVALCYRWAEPIFVRLGHNGMNVVSRISSFLLISIGVSITWGGITGLLQTLPHAGL